MYIQAIKIFSTSTNNYRIIQYNPLFPINSIPIIQQKNCMFLCTKSDIHEGIQFPARLELWRCNQSCRNAAEWFGPIYTQFKLCGELMIMFNFEYGPFNLNQRTKHKFNMLLQKCKETEARKEGYMKQSTLKFNFVSLIQKINFVICFFSYFTVFSW